MRRASRAIVAASGVVMGAVGSASAQFGNQPADNLSLPGGGSSVNSTRDTALHADNFIMTEDVVLTQIDWAGYVYDLGTPADVAGFWVEIYTDSDPVDGAFGVPGELYYSALLPVEQPWITTAFIGAGWMSQTFYHYSAETSIDLPAGDYWLHIAASMDNTGRAFVWAQHTGGNGDDLSALARTTQPELGFSQTSNDFAFVLTAEPAAEIDDYIALISSQVMGLDLSLFDAPNANAASGRRGALANQFGVVLRHIENERYSAALSKLQDLSGKIDQWIIESPERDELQLLIAEITALIAELI